MIGRPSGRSFCKDDSISEGSGHSPPRLLLCLSLISRPCPAEAFVALKKAQPGLATELARLPGWKSGSLAAGRIARLAATSTNPEVKEAFAIILKGHAVHDRLSREHGDYVSIGIVAYSLPPYNTALQVLYELAGAAELPPDDCTALSIAISNSFFVTFGDAEVQKSALITSMAFYRFLRSVRDLQTENGRPPLSGYPLEALLQMCRLWGTGMAAPSLANPKAGAATWNGDSSGFFLVPTFNDFRVADTSRWTVAKVDSQESHAGDYRALHAIDGDPFTIWHSSWTSRTPPLPESITIDLGLEQKAAGIVLFARQDHPDGIITGYELFGSSTLGGKEILLSSGRLT